jgi:hypothetical protein
MTKRNQNQIQTVEMEFLRSVVGYFLLEKKRNEDESEELEIYNLHDKIQQYRNQWFSHTEQMEQYHLPRQAWEYHPQGR